MGRTVDEIMKSLPAARRRKIEARAAALVAEEASLQDLRKAMGLTQTRMAQRLGVGQDTVSRIERRADMLLSTLGEYVKGMGGELSLIAEFPGRPPVRLAMLEPLSRAPARRAKKPARSRLPAPARKRRKPA
ncbi:Helix-turn-helix domain-containing protein [Amphiplicatus metriothermophilus]|uniref:Helix-turn-helix domain-containing protein n=1 Tax=Amphiplicatus metriothermophilus TaxID=1519374 RepID=A0A239PPE5_9PROT|nr:Helix-turn-helix domain-containing protein [Amphiplicatus metriothermophilus]